MITSFWMGFAQVSGLGTMTYESVTYNTVLLLLLMLMMMTQRTRELQENGINMKPYHHAEVP